jgi:hypothetical protein
MNDEVELRYGLGLYRDEALQLAETRVSVSERFLRYMSEPSKLDGVSCVLICSLSTVLSGESVGIVGSLANQSTLCFR